MQGCHNSCCSPQDPSNSEEDLDSYSDEYSDSEYSDSESERADEALRRRYLKLACVVKPPTNNSLCFDVSLAKEVCVCASDSPLGVDGLK